MQPTGSAALLEAMGLGGKGHRGLEADLVGIAIFTFLKKEREINIGCRYKI